MANRTLPLKKSIALVAHDSCKQQLTSWAVEHLDKLIGFNIIATGSTGKDIQEATGQPVKRLLSGPYGGDQQLGSMIAEGAIHLIVFFWDALEQQAHDNDVKALQRLAVLWNIPLACNKATADFMITSPYLMMEYVIDVPETSD